MNAESVAELLANLAGSPLRAGKDLLHRSENFLLLFDEDVEWDASECPDGGIYHGRQGVCEFFVNYLAVWDWYSFNVKQVSRPFNGTDLLVEVEEYGSCHGIMIHQSHWQVWMAEEGDLVTYWRSCKSFADAVDLVCPPVEEEA
jgi:hypothetical protein